MEGVSCVTVWWGRTGELLLLWISITVPPSLLQPPLPLSLPVQMSVTPPSWQFLPLSQAELGPLFSNFSPFAFSQSMFMLPPTGWATKPGLRASFGPHSVTQLLSESVLPASPPLSASLLSESVEVERDKRGQERFRVRVLFHKRGNISSDLRTCITLMAFKETEEHKASCITQPPLGLCVVTLTLPSSWYSNPLVNQSHPWYSNTRHTHQWMQKRKWQRSIRRHGNHQQATAQFLRYHPNIDGDMDGPRARRNQRGPMKNQIQLYYSVADLQMTSAGCVEDRDVKSQRQLFYIKAVTLKEAEDKGKEQSNTKQNEPCTSGQEEEELNLDSHVVIRYHRGPVLIGQPIRVSVNLRANVSGHFAAIRMKVKKGLVSIVAQRTLTSDMWTVTLERTQASKHDVLSILCHRQRKLKQPHDPTLLQQVACLSVDGLRRSFGVAMMVPANWWVEYSRRTTVPPSHVGAVSIFSFTDRHIFGIAPITESNTLINTAILNNQPVLLPVIVLAVSHDEKVSDVTSAVTCHSINENSIKVSSDCSTLYVDGSESGLGSTCAVVEFHLGMLSGSVCLEVWAPSVPLHVSLADPTLNVIDGWNLITEKGCVPVYQRSSVQVLTQFTAQDSHSRTTHHLGSSDWFVDVTELVSNWLRVEDPRVASLRPQNIVIGLRPGKTSLHVISEQWDGMLGTCDITVSSDTVSAGDLSVQAVSGLGMSVKSSPAHPSIITATVTAYNTMYHYHQEASVSVWLQFSDDTASLLSSFSDLPFSLRLSSLAESVIMVTPSSNQRVFAQGDGGGPLLRAELLVSTCADQLIVSNSFDEENEERQASTRREGTRRLARGSGWIRVNLDLDFMQPVAKKSEDGVEFEFDISDTLVESHGDIYSSNKDESWNVSTSSNYYEKVSQTMTNRRWNEVDKGGMVSRNTLERAVLMPSLDEGKVYFFPSQDKGGAEEDKQGAHELELGVGAVLSLLCLFAVLFLANCLPSTLRHRSRRTKERMEGELEAGATEDGEEMEREKAKDWKT
ncbi:transmembrane protein 132C isoform X2 [Simochromis diagramma]|nr:transmembrane protein 132C isoform X2 [Simochromis diagramma]XP_039883171.1 transmembrane protein 132C isoform X2 [Simochromis diagramma]